MALRRIVKFSITCDGYKPDGQPCGRDFTIEAFGQHDAEDAAKRYGWYHDHRGWLCNARDGHSDD